MGIFKAIRAALGLQHPIELVTPDGLIVTDAARDRLRALRHDEALHIRPVPSGDEYLVSTTLAPLSDLADEAISPLWVDDPDGRLSGLELHFDADRFSVRAVLDLRGEPTPNPDGRLYTTSRTWVRGRPQFFRSTDEDAEHPPLVRRLLSIPDVVSVLVRENTITLKRANELSWRTLDEAIEVKLREYLLHGGLALPERPRSGADSDLLEKARLVLAEQIGAAVHADGGDIELVDISDGVAHVKMLGACAGCPAAGVTLEQGVHTVLTEAFPEQITGVEPV